MSVCWLKKLKIWFKTSSQVFKTRLQVKNSSQEFKTRLQDKTSSQLGVSCVPDWDCLKIFMYCSQRKSKSSSVQKLSNVVIFCLNNITGPDRG